MLRLSYILFFTAAVLVTGFGFDAIGATHPMDPLSAGEIRRATQILQQSGNVSRGARAVIVRAAEWPKSDVLEWRDGQPIQRRAEYIIRQESRLYRAIIDLNSGEVASWQHLPGKQAPVLADDSAKGNQIVRASDAWRAALRSRGITNPNQVICLPVSVGYYGNPRSDRVVRMLCYQSGGVDNYFGRMIEGLSVLVNLDRERIEELTDTGPKPMPDGPVDYNSNAVGTLRLGPTPIRYNQSGGASYRISGNVVSWQKWDFHYRIDPQVGLVISTVSYRDDDRRRDVLYQGHLSEIFVPYMDPDKNWYFRTFLDAGEYAFGLSTSPQMRGLDCPEDATMLDAVLADASGNPQNLPRAVSIFERYAGNPNWRHMDPMTGRTESRRDQELVLRQIATSGNYDYIFDWIFRVDGSIRVQVGATGIVAAKAVDSEDALDAGAAADGRYGRFVADHTVAVNQDHFVNLRLELGVDGTANSFVRAGLKPVSFSGETPRRSGWVLDEQTLQREEEAKLIRIQSDPALWRVVNGSRTNAHGNPVSYQVAPGANGISLLDPRDWPQRRAAFSAYNLHVTPYREDEKYAAGEFPNQTDDSEGLGRWTQSNRSIDNRDIVVWYTVGFHHVVRAEDWPVMPTTWHGFELRPFDFFDRNPALDVPR